MTTIADASETFTATAEPTAFAEPHPTADERAEIRRAIDAAIAEGRFVEGGIIETLHPFTGESLTLTVKSADEKIAIGADKSGATFALFADAFVADAS